MFVRILLRLLIMAAVVGITAALVPGIHVNGGFFALIWIAVIFSLVNAIIGPIVRLLSLPFIILTLGLFLLVINAGLLALTAWLSSHLDIDSFGAALAGGIVIAVLSFFADLLLPIGREKKKAATS